MFRTLFSISLVAVLCLMGHVQAGRYNKVLSILGTPLRPLERPSRG